MDIHNNSFSQGEVINQALKQSEIPAFGTKHRGLVFLAGIALCFLFALFQAQTVQAAVAYASVSLATQDDKDNDFITFASAPSGTAAGDLLLAVIATKKTDKNTGVDNVLTPTGWTEVQQGANIDNAGLAVFYRIAGAAESGPYTFNVDSNVEEISGAILRYTGVDTTTPIDVSGGQSGKSTSPTAPSVTTTYANTMVVRAFGQKDNNNAVTPPSGTTERVEQRDARDKVTLGVADALQATTDPTGPASFTGTDDKDYHAITVVLVPEQVVLTIDKTTTTPTVDAGNNASYSITVNNTGGAEATGVVVSDTLPSGFSFVSTDSGSCGTGPSNGATGTVTWSSCSLPVSGSLTLAYTVNVAVATPGGIYTNAASVDSDQTDPVGDSVDVTVRDADLAITKTVDNAYPNEGGNITYTLTATNNGGGNASGVTVADTLPAGVTWVSTVPSQGSCSAPSGVTCELGSIANGHSATVTITATVNTGLGDSALLTNTASVSADQNDPVSGNNSDTADATTCPANHLHNIASVSSGVSDPNAANNSDHICTEVVKRDFGDAPASYGDASHRIPGTPTIYLGSVTPDAELTSQSNADADGDDDPSTGTDDEDGVTFRSPAGTNQSIFADVAVVTGGASVTVCGWLDIPSGGTVGLFEPGEGSCQTTAADGTLTFQWSNLPQDQSYTTYARFRVCSTPAECNAPTGSATDGEAEDYRIEFDFTPTAVTIGEVSLVAESVAEFLSGLGEDGGIDAMLALLAGFDPGLAEALADASAAEIRAALIAYLDPDGDGQVAILRWQTLQERGTVGFYAERRVGDIGNWERINDDLLPGLIDAPLGGEYWLADPAAVSGETYQYQLMELEAWGTQRDYGPWTLSLPQ